jgi:hypothetical protein
MKNIFLNSRGNMNYVMAVSLSLPCSAFLLQGCCFSSEMYASKNPCNCRTNQPAYAANNSTETFAHEAIDAKNSASTIFHYASSLNSNNSHGENSRHDPALLQKASKKVPSNTKTPLGIKSIRSHIIAGPNISFKSSKEDYGSTGYKHKPGVGFQFGFGSTYSFSKHFAVSTALIFKHNSASETLSYSTGEPGGGNYSQEYKSKYSYNYLSVPILAEVKISEQLSVAAGPEINYLLGSSVKESGYSEGKTSLTKSSVKFGGGVQVGIKYEIPGSPIGMQLIYDHRVSRLNKKSSSEDYPGGSYDIPAWNMKSIQLGVTCAICQLLKGRK